MGIKTSKRRGLAGRIASALINPKTLRFAVAVLRVIDLAARVYDHWRS